MSPEGSEMQKAEPTTSVTAPASTEALALVVQGCGTGSL
jgi:hypothetical protein